MGRLKILLSSSPDRETLLHTEKAREELEEAVRTCRRAQDAVYKVDGRRSASVHRLRGLEAAIRGALRSLDSIRRVSPLYDLTDPDLRPLDMAPPGPARKQARPLIHKTA